MKYLFCVVLVISALLLYHGEYQGAAIIAGFYVIILGNMCGGGSGTIEGF